MSNKPRSAEKSLEEEDFSIGPMSLLQQAVINNKQVWIKCQDNKQLVGHVRSFDRHFNMVLENVKEMWRGVPTGKKGKTISKDRFISKMKLRGDSVIMVIRNPWPPATAPDEK